MWTPAVGVIWWDGRNFRRQDLAGENRSLGTPLRLCCVPSPFPKPLCPLSLSPWLPISEQLCSSSPSLPVFCLTIAQQQSHARVLWDYDPKHSFNFLGSVGHAVTATNSKVWLVQGPATLRFRTSWHTSSQPTSPGLLAHQAGDSSAVKMKHFWPQHTADWIPPGCSQPSSNSITMKHPCSF